MNILFFVFGLNEKKKILVILKPREGRAAISRDCPADISFVKVSVT